MIKISNKSRCVSCYACKEVCPKKCIHFYEDQEGFFYPKVDIKHCIECGCCDNVCPILNHHCSNNDLTPKVYAAWNNDEKIRLDSTSGGIFSLLASLFYSRSSFVSGAVYDSEWHVCHIVSNDSKDISRLRSSKYLQSDISNVFAEIKRLLLSGQEVLFVGSPCQVAGLYNYLGTINKKLYTIDFICKGMNSPKVFDGYISSLESKYGSKVTEIKFKDKTNGWHNFSTRIEFENGKKYIGSRYFDSYMIGYLEYNAFMRPSCYDCQYKEMPRQADITLADFWGIQNIDNSLDENKGTSMVVINSEKGKWMIDSIRDQVFIKQVQSEDSYKDNISIRESEKMSEERIGVFEHINVLSYDELSNKYFPVPKGIKKIAKMIKYNETVQKLYQRIRYGK